MKIDEAQALRVAKLARLFLSQEELERFPAQLSAIIDYVEKINLMNTDSAAPAEHIADIKNVFRKDTVGTCIKTEVLEKLSPQFGNGHFIVPKVLE